MKRRDVVGQLEADLFDSLGEARLQAQCLALLVATCQAQNLALADARGKQNERLLCQLMAAENRPGRRSGRRKAPKGDADARRTR